MVKVMLLEFTVGNFLSFKEKVTISMEAAPIKELEESNVFTFGKYELLKSAAIYGANASGKSNLIKAMSRMKNLIQFSANEDQAEIFMKTEKFRLDKEMENKPSFFEIAFIHNQKKYRYGFEIDKERVYSEWLFFTPTRQEARLFVRDGENIEIGTTYFKEGKGLEDKTRPNALFLSVVAQFNGEFSAKIMKWFKRFNVISGLDDRNYLLFALDQFEKDDFKQKHLQYLKIADFGIDDEDVRKNEPLELPEGIKGFLSKMTESEPKSIKGYTISIFHSKYDKNEKLPYKESFALTNESDGTQKYFYLLAPILDTLNKGSILVVDELDARLHPYITRFIIQLFHSKQTNPYNAQIIFATHDTNLLDKDLFRRDQIWFTEKDQYGATDLFSLVEYKVRNDVDFEKYYLNGKFGGVPFVKNFEVLLGDGDE
jgi:uncharacterized protein